MSPKSSAQPKQTPINNLKEMKKIVAYIACLALLITACKDKKESCPYQIGHECKSSDENLYISYQINNVKYTYYLGALGGGSFHNFVTSATNGEYALCQAYYCGFNESLSEIPVNTLCSPFVLTFFNYIVANSSTPLKFGEYRLHEVLNIKKYKFTTSKNQMMNAPLADTLFMQGVSLKSGQYSTSNIMEYYDYDYEKIYSDILNPSNSFFKITSMEPVCSGYYIIKGEFATKLMNKLEPHDIIDVKNGTFQFLIN